MPLQLLVRLGLTPEYPVEICIVSEDNRVLQANNGAELHSITPSLSGNNALILLPSQILRLDTTRLPQGRLKDLQKAVPFAFEDSLCEEPSQCHFAIKHRQGQEYSIAMIDKALMREWVQVLADANSPSAPMIPDVLALPWASEEWSLLVEEHQLLLRIDESQGYHIPIADYEYWLGLLLQQKPTLPKLIHCYNVGKATFDITVLHQILPTIEVVQTHYANAMIVFSKGLKTQTELFNLRQGEFLQSRTLALTSLWRAAIYGIVSLSMWHLMSTYAENYLLKEKRQAFDVQILNRYQQIFPNAPMVSDPKHRLQQEYARLKQEAIGSAWQHTLAGIATALQNTAGNHLLSISFKDPKLTAMIRSDNFSDLGKLVKNLEKSRFSVKQNQARTEEQGVISELVIEEIPS